MHFRPTLSDCAGFFNCSEDSISRLIKKKENLSFWDFREKYFGATRIRLRQKALQLAFSGDRALLIFLLKNFCGMRDNPEFDFEPQQATLEFIDQNEN
jgi:hypothetical protein